MRIGKLWLFALIVASLSGQEVIRLYSGAAPGSEDWNYPEKQYFSKVWNTEVVTNVTQPTLTVYKPDPARASGTSVIICPGGGFMALSIASEGTEVAKWLTAKGVTAFVLKYRLAHTGEDATKEFMDAFQDQKKFNETIGKVIPISIADGLCGHDLRAQACHRMGSGPGSCRHHRLLRGRNRRSGRRLWVHVR